MGHSLSRRALVLIALLALEGSASPTGSNQVPDAPPQRLDGRENGPGSWIPVHALSAAVHADVSRWIRQRERVTPGFRGGRVWVMRGQSFRPDLVQPLQGEDLNPPLFRAVIWSPDRRRYLDPDMYRGAHLEDGAIEISGDADSAPVMGDLRTKTSVRLGFHGPQGPYYDGWWVDDSRLAVAGEETNDDRPPLSYGTLDLFDLDRNTVTRITTAPHQGQSNQVIAMIDSVMRARYSKVRATLPGDSAGHLVVPPQRVGHSPPP